MDITFEGGGGKDLVNDKESEQGSDCKEKTRAGGSG